MSLTRRTLLLGLLFAPVVTLAHGGRTDRAGCHNSRRGRHCHGTRKASPPQKTKPTRKAPPPPQKRYKVGDKWP